MKKKSNMYSLLLWAWVLTIFYFDLKLLSLLIGPENLIAKGSVIIFVSCLNIFWLYGIYHIFVPLYSLHYRRFYQKNKSDVNIIDNNFHPRVAILYTTKDDFNESAVKSCLKQQYSNFTVFICDDSTDPKCREWIDSFVINNADVKIIRREERTGYKAGNLNHSIRIVEKNYPYFAVCDADTILPKDFIKNLIPYFSRDSKLGFVQAVQASNQNQETKFARELNHNIDLHWNYYVPAKEKYGFTMFYGHGAIIRTSAWQKVGGFTEIATEDLDFSIKLKESGYIGITDLNTVCCEDFPTTYNRFRRRSEKWIKGTAEVLKRNWRILIFSRNLRWFEKVDIIISAVSLLISTPFLIFVMTVGFILPHMYNLFKFGGPLIFTPIFVARNWTSYLLSVKYNVFWTWDLFAVMILMIFGPSFPVVISLYKTPKRLFHYMSYSTFIYLGSMVSSTINLISYIITKKAPFLITGETLNNKRTGRRLSGYMELAIGILLIFFTFKYMNIWLGAVASSLCISVFILNKDWQTKPLRLLVHIPFTTTLAIVGLIVFSILKKF